MAIVSVTKKKVPTASLPNQGGGPYIGTSGPAPPPAPTPPMGGYLGGSSSTGPYIGTLPIGIPGAGGGTGGGAGGAGAPPPDPFDYLGAISGDPVYQKALASYNSALGAGRTSLDDQIRQAVIASGYDPRSQMTGSLADYASAIDDPTALAASQNQFSAKNQIQQQLDRQLSALNYRLAARGALQSGALATGGGLLNQQSQQAGYQQMNSLLDAIRGGASGYGDLVTQQQSQLDQIREQVAARLAQLYGG